VHAADPAVFASVRRVLAAFARARNPAGAAAGAAATGGGGSAAARRGLDGALARAYAPVLWRALDARNSAVRRNAATLFRDVFPLGLADAASAAERDAAVAQQVAAMAALVDDATPAVREIGVGFIAEALARFWSLLPALARSRLLDRVASRCDDAVAPGVRAEAIRGLTAILAAEPAAHGALASSGALGAAARLLHDKQERVRAAAVELLVAVEG
jgi:hypothetical protein